jgi:hypothetical protein
VILDPLTGLVDKPPDLPTLQAELQRAHLRLSNVLASKSDHVPLVDDERPASKVELAPGEAFYLEYQVERETNPKGAVRFTLKKMFGQAEIWVSESLKRPGPNAS